MIWFFIVSILMWTFSIVYVWKAKEYIRDEMRIVRVLQIDCCQKQKKLGDEIDRTVHLINGWEHRLEIMHNDIRKLKKAQKQEGNEDV